MAGQVERLQRRATLEAVRGDLAGLKHGCRVVVVAPILRADHEKNRLAVDQRVGQEGLASKRRQLLAEWYQPRRFQLLRAPLDRLEPNEIIVAPRVSVRERTHQVDDRRAERFHPGQRGGCGRLRLGRKGDQ